MYNSLEWKNLKLERKLKGPSKGGDERKGHFKCKKYILKCKEYIGDLGTILI